VVLRTRRDCCQKRITSKSSGRASQAPMAGRFSGGIRKAETALSMATPTSSMPCSAAYRSMISVWRSMLVEASSGLFESLIMPSDLTISASPHSDSLRVQPDEAIGGAEAGKAPQPRRGSPVQRGDGLGPVGGLQPD